MSHSIQVVARHDVAITSPTFGPSGDLFAISQNGDIYRYFGNTEYDNEFSVESWGNSSGQPLGLHFDPTGVAFVCDAAHQAIFRYFTDSGPLGETSLQNPKGSVFVINPETLLLIPLAYQSLAYPSGIALSPDEKVLYVSETCSNRILRFSQNPPGVYHCSVFHQLSGRFGPTALTVNAHGDLFVAHFDFAENTENGRILVIDSDGEVSAIMSVPGPEITGLCLTPDEKYLLIAEASSHSLYRHPLR